MEPPSSIASDPFDLLPDETIMHIARFLPSADVLKFKSTCNRMNATCKTAIFDHTLQELKEVKNSDLSPPEIKRIEKLLNKSYSILKYFAPNANEQFWGLHLMQEVMVTFQSAHILKITDQELKKDLIMSALSINI